MVNGRDPRRMLAVFLVSGILAACGAATEEAGPRTIQPGAPGEPGRVLTGEERRASAGLPHTDSDARFMRNMILHHRQAVEMARLAPDRAAGDDIRLLARRILRSQDDEIALMRRWLEARGEEPPEPGAGHEDGAHAPEAHAVGDAEGPTLMAGMLTRQQLDELAAAEGEEFDRLFLEFMIFHHEGALDMVEELFATPGAGQEGEIFQFASHVDSDQRIEILRMSRMLRAYR